MPLLAFGGLRHGLDLNGRTVGSALRANAVYPDQNGNFEGRRAEVHAVPGYNFQRSRLAQLPRLPPSEYSHIAWCPLGARLLSSQSGPEYTVPEMV
jgi:hypothetical protein